MRYYEKIVEAVHKLNQCLRMSGKVDRDLVHKLDLLTKPRLGLALAAALWANRAFKSGIVGYGELVDIEVRIAKFLKDAHPSELKTLENLFNLIPARYGLSVDIIASRCAIDASALFDFLGALNILRDSLNYMEFVEGQKLEPPKVCADDADLLPPAQSNAQLFLELALTALKSNQDLLSDPFNLQVVEIVEERLSRGRVEPNDAAAIALLIMALCGRCAKPICAEPAIRADTLAKRVYADTTALGADPEDSDIYELYKELARKAVIYGYR